MRTEWMLEPSARLGGDAFGYGPLDDHMFALYLIDVSGHGVSAAMLSVSVMNVLRERALPATDFKVPELVLSALNAMFQMDRHDDRYFTIWYGVYDSLDRMLTYATGGHHAGSLVPVERDHAQTLKTSGPPIGAIADARFDAARTRVPAGSALYLFSDGVFEVRTAA
jgi:sigma-B regulation protein RsbU (phosphoserine phosphatase)